MSTILSSAQTRDDISSSTKKRKHDGESKEPKKKRKQLGEAVEVDGVNGSTSKSERKERKQRNKDRDTSASVKTEADTGSVASDDAETSPALKKDKTRGKATRREEVDPATDVVDDRGGDKLRIDSKLTDVPVEGSVSQSASTPRKEKRKKKKVNSVEDELPLSAAPEHLEPPVQSVTDDIELPDAPDLEQEVEQPAEQVMPQNQQLESTEATSFYSTRLSLYLPIPPVGLANSISAILSLHLAPLLLTYFPPAGGMILSYHDPVLSARPDASLNKAFLPPSSGDIPSNRHGNTFTKVGEEFGACWAWLTATFLVFKPEGGDELKGWTNVLSEGFIGVVCYNYFQAAVGKSRIPKSWTWTGASRRQRKTPRKGRLNDSDEPSQEAAADSQETVVAREDDAFEDGVGTFLDDYGSQIPETMGIRVADLEIVPAAERGKWSLQIEGTLLNEEEEAEVRVEERQKYENRMSRSRSRSKPGTPMMSGGLPTHSRAGSVVSTP